MRKRIKVIGIAPQVVVTDVVRTAEYYRDELGFSSIGYFLDPPLYAMAERDGFQIHFGKYDSGQPAQMHSCVRSALTSYSGYRKSISFMKSLRRGELIS
ncbi:MAG TPA: hypothetical protein VI603_05495 [Saprospiraceae bacterium]|nr:hypothetical protein [Saprospiraceae bacterium]